MLALTGIVLRHAAGPEACLLMVSPFGVLPEGDLLRLKELLTGLERARVVEIF